MTDRMTSYVATTPRLVLLLRRRMPMITGALSSLLNGILSLALINKRLANRSTNEQTNNNTTASGSFVMFFFIADDARPHPSHIISEQFQ
jgi:hypothetical protein